MLKLENFGDYEQRKNVYEYRYIYSHEFSHTEETLEAQMAQTPNISDLYKIIVGTNVQSLERAFHVHSNEL